MKAAMLAIALLAAAAPAAPMDSQEVIALYAKTLLEAPVPRVLVFTYTVSQAGPHDIEQTHRIYRSGDEVRDETMLVDGVKQKTIRISRYRNRYTLEDLAPRLTQYTFLFDGVQRSGSTFEYAYHAVPNTPGGTFVIDSMVLNGRSYLPALLRFHSYSGAIRGTGTITFVHAGKYWVPSGASVDARVNGKPAREQIAFNGYRFPARLPQSTFQARKPLPPATLPAF
ncbi:MAG: hypothetical protein ABR508_00650 [Candidatus Baltobacteraceae bacterium]